MKWSIAGLLVLGLVAALCTTLLVSSVLARQETEPIAQDQTHVDIVVAKRPLSALTVVSGGDLEVRSVPKDELPEEYLSNAVQVAGKVLATAVTEGQPFTPGLFADKGSGIHLAAAIPPGMRAVSISLSDYSGLEGLLYPGCVVDVAVSFRPSQDARLGEAISTTILEGVQVLAVESRTVVSPGDQAADAGLRSGRKRVVTLMVTSQQAKAVQLAMEHGAISLALRNPLDDKTPDAGVVAMSDLLHNDARIASRDELAAMIAESESSLMRSIEAVARAVRGTQRQADVPVPPTPQQVSGAQAATPTSTRAETASSAQVAPPPDGWSVMIIRGATVETKEFGPGT